jgi:hypothetical protein
LDLLAPQNVRHFGHALIKQTITKIDRGIVEGGLRIIARRRAPARLPQIAEGGSPSPLKAFVLAMMSIQEAAMNRLGWADKSATLEVMAIALAGGAKRRFLHCELVEKL